MDVLRQCIERAQSRAGRATQVVHRGAVSGKIRPDLADHALDLVVKRNGPRQHIVKDGRRLLAKSEVMNLPGLILKNSIHALFRHT